MKGLRKIIRKIIHESYVHENNNSNYGMPSNWSLFEEYNDGDSLIFRDSTNTFQISVDLGIDVPFEINFNQLKGDFILIGFEDGAYATHANNREEAIQKAIEMAEFINSKNKFID